MTLGLCQMTPCGNWRRGGGCEGGETGGEGRIVAVVVVVVVNGDGDGDINGNGGRRRPQTEMQLILPGEDGGRDGSQGEGTV